MKRPFVETLAELQDGLCPICGAVFAARAGLSVDHVWPRLGALGATGLYGNALAAHAHCNSAKGDRVPTGCEIVWLTAVNARLGVEPRALSIPTIVPTLAALWPAT